MKIIKKLISIAIFLIGLLFIIISLDQCSDPYVSLAIFCPIIGIVCIFISGVLFGTKKYKVVHKKVGK